MCVQMCEDAHIHTYTYTHSRTQAALTHTHTHTHTHTQAMGKAAKSFDLILDTVSAGGDFQCYFICYYIIFLLIILSFIIYRCYSFTICVFSSSSSARSRQVEILPKKKILRNKRSAVNLGTHTIALTFFVNSRDHAVRGHAEDI